LQRRSYRHTARSSLSKLLGIHYGVRCSRVYVVALLDEVLE